MNRVVRQVLGGGLVALGSTLLLLLGLAWPHAELHAPDPSVLLQDRHGTYLGEVNVPKDGRLGFWPAGPAGCDPLVDTSCLPERVVAATLAIEDRRFHTHPGIDPVGLTRALHQNLTHSERISGASTLAMQVARMQDPGPRTYAKKAVESLTALLLVDHHGRDAVLAHYLRLAPYGNNVHGVRYAARRYFRKPLADLTWAEASLLAALPQAPGQMNPYDPTGRRRASKRATRILDLLHRDGTIDTLTHERAVSELSRLRFGARPTRPEATLLPVLGLDGLPANDPEVRTTLDLELQEHIERLALHRVLDWESHGAGQAAVVVAERETMAVRAAVGSIGYHGTHAGQIDFTSTPRYPGSTLKPFLYAHALDRGALQPGDVLDDLMHGPQGIRNADNQFLGPMLPRMALANSRNVPTVALADRIGLDAVFAAWEELGLHDGERTADHYGLGLVIGGMPVTLRDLVTAYGALANDGELRPLDFLGAPGPTRPVFSPAHARLVGRWLSDPVARTPTFARQGNLELPFATAVKTGTSPDFRDSWAVGWTEGYVVGVWLGHPDWRPMRDLSGSRGAARVLKDVLLHLHASKSDGLAKTAFPAPEGWEAVEVCAHTGSLAGPYCEAPRTEWFAPGAEPVHDCAVHELENGRVVADLPSRYARWMRESGIRAAERIRDDGPVEVAVLSPAPGTHVVRDPEVPADRSTLRLQASVDPPVSQVVWLVDGEPFAVVDYPYVARWPIEPGDHTFEARLAFRPEHSERVAVSAR